ILRSSIPVSAKRNVSCRYAIKRRLGRRYAKSATRTSGRARPRRPIIHKQYDIRHDLLVIESQVDAPTIHKSKVGLPFFIHSRFHQGTPSKSLRREAVRENQRIGSSKAVSAIG